jgi:hypothetical protein
MESNSPIRLTFAVRRRIVDVLPNLNATIQYMDIDVYVTFMPRVRQLNRASSTALLSGYS